MNNNSYKFCLSQTINFTKNSYDASPGVLTPNLQRSKPYTKKFIAI